MHNSVMPLTQVIVESTVESVLALVIFALVILQIVLYRRYAKVRETVQRARTKESDLVKENEMLDQMSRMKTLFFQNMSHDFKTPLAVISTSVLNAMDEIDHGMDKEEVYGSLDLAQREIMRMARLVDSALRHASMHDDKQTLEPVDFLELLRNITETYKTFLELRGNILTLKTPETLPKIMGNSDMLLNVFSNLLSNANRFTRNGEIQIVVDVVYETIAINRKQSFVDVKVIDDGIGIDSELLPHLLKRGATTDGMGLGLSICKTIIEEHGGSIEVSGKYGKGFVVTFTIPAAEAAEQRGIA